MRGSIVLDKTRCLSSVRGIVIENRPKVGAKKKKRAKRSSVANLTNTMRF